MSRNKAQEFAALVKYHREKRGLTEEEFAALVRCDVGSIHRAEQGKWVAAESLVKIWAKQLKLSPDEIREFYEILGYRLPPELQLSTQELEHRLKSLQSTVDSLAAYVLEQGYSFENFVVDLLASQGYQDIQQANDHGFDLLATYPRKLPDGAVDLEEWAVIVKHSTKAVPQALFLGWEKLRSALQAGTVNKALIVTSGNLTASANQFLQETQHLFPGLLTIWDRDHVLDLARRSPLLVKRYSPLFATFPPSLSAPPKTKDQKLIEELKGCPPGKAGWQDFERLCIDILTEVLVPPLKRPKKQARTLSSLERRDAMFSLRGTQGGWAEIRREFDANFLLCEFKNYGEPFTKDEVNQTRNYLKKTIGRLAIILSRKGPDDGALRMRNTIYSEEKKIILFFDDNQLIELLKLKAVGEDPLTLIDEAIENFYLSHE